MSLFKKSDESFLAKLFKHKQVDELAEELAHTYVGKRKKRMNEVWQSVCSINY